MDLHIANQLWNLLPHPSSDHIVRLFGRDKDGKVIGDFARKPWEIKKFANACSGTYNCYVCPNPTLRNDGVRHSAEDVSHWSFLLIDIDPVGEKPEPELALLEVLNRLSGLFGRDLYKDMPTIIHSGRGVQIWLRGEDKEFTPEFTRGKVRRIMSFWLTNLLSKRLGMINDCKIDTSTSDLPRPMRMPGTMNLKTGENSHFLEIQKEPYPWLFPTLIAGTPDEALIEHEITARGDKVRDIFRFLTPSAQSYLQLGKEEPGRHKICFHTAKSLAELGISRERARLAIGKANKLRGPNEELSAKDIEHCLDVAYGEKTLDTLP